MNFINNEISYIYDEPATYKDIVLYPITIRDYLKFYTYIDCLLVDKNSIPDINIISMSYLQYLAEITDEKNLYYVKLIQLLKLCLDWKDDLIRLSEKEAKTNYELGKDVLVSKTEYPNDDNSITINNKNGISWKQNSKLVKLSIGEKPFYFNQNYLRIVFIDNKWKLQIKDTFYSSLDFDNIKNIILDQNDVERFDEKIPKNIRDDLEKKQEIANKMKGAIKFCDFEDQMVCVSISLGLSLEEVKKITIRKFRKYIFRINRKVDYDFTIGYMAAGVDPKKNKYPEHWMADFNSKNKYSSIIMDDGEYAELENKIK